MTLKRVGLSVALGDESTLSRGKECLCSVQCCTIANVNHLLPLQARTNPWIEPEGSDRKPRQKTED